MIKLIIEIIVCILLGLALGLPVAGIIWFFGGGFHYLASARMIAVVCIITSFMMYIGEIDFD